MKSHTLMEYLVTLEMLFKKATDKINEDEKIYKEVKFTTTRNDLVFTDNDIPNYKIKVIDLFNDMLLKENVNYNIVNNTILFEPKFKPKRYKIQFMEVMGIE